MARGRGRGRDAGRARGGRGGRVDGVTNNTSDGEGTGGREGEERGEEGFLSSRSHTSLTQYLFVCRTPLDSESRVKDRREARRWRTAPRLRSDRLHPPPTTPTTPRAGSSQPGEAPRPDPTRSHESWGQGSGQKLVSGVFGVPGISFARTVLQGSEHTGTLGSRHPAWEPNLSSVDSVCPSRTPWTPPERRGHTRVGDPYGHTQTTQHIRTEKGALCPCDAPTHIYRTHRRRIPQTDLTPNVHTITGHTHTDKHNTPVKRTET